MARILHLEDEIHIRRKVSTILESARHTVVGCSNDDEARTSEEQCGPFDLYICGSICKYSDGLSFATDMRNIGRKVIILAYRRKFSLVPFMSLSSLREEETALQMFERALTGD